MTKHSAWAQTCAFVAKAYRYSNGNGVVPFLIQLGVAFLLIKFVLFPGLGLLFGTQLPVVAVMSGSMEHDDTNGIVCGLAVPAGYSGSFDDYWKLCGAWYEQHGISRSLFEEFSLHSGFNKGDIMVIVGPTRGTVELGDTIVYQSGEAYPIIHRVIGVNTSMNGSTVYATKGDYNGEQISLYVVRDGAGRVSACHKAGKPAACGDAERVTRATPGAIAVLDENNVQASSVIGRAVFRIPWLGWVKIGAANALRIVTG